MTDEMTPEQLERIARLQARRSSPKAQSARPAGEVDASPTMATRPQRRRHPALGSRIAAAGMGATSMFAIVGVLGLRDREAQNAETQPMPVPEVVERPITVVVHRIPASTTTSVPAQPTSTAPSAPIELTANTVVRTVTVTEAPRRRRSSGGSSGGGGGGGGGGGATPAAPAPAPPSNASSGGSN